MLATCNYLDWNVLLQFFFIGVDLVDGLCFSFIVVPDFDCQLQLWVRLWRC